MTGEAWTRHDVSRRKRGMFDKFIARDMDGDGDADFVGMRGNSYPYDGVFWLEQVRAEVPGVRFVRGRGRDSGEVWCKVPIFQRVDDVTVSTRSNMQ